MNFNGLWGDKVSSTKPEEAMSSVVYTKKCAQLDLYENEMTLLGRVNKEYHIHKLRWYVDAVWEDFSRYMKLFGAIRGPI